MRKCGRGRWETKNLDLQRTGMYVDGERDAERDLRPGNTAATLGLVSRATRLLFCDKGLGWQAGNVCMYGMLCTEMSLPVCLGLD